MISLEPAVLCRKHPPCFTAEDCGLQNATFQQQRNTLGYEEIIDNSKIKKTNTRFLHALPR
jgi:hypothetical protein